MHEPAGAISKLAPKGGRARSHGDLTDLMDKLPPFLLLDPYLEMSSVNSQIQGRKGHLLFSSF